jgi:hypothetical protein
LWHHPYMELMALARDVFFYDLRDLSAPLGCLVRTNGIAKVNFYFMIEIVLVISSCYLIQDSERDSSTAYARRS